MPPFRYRLLDLDASIQGSNIDDNLLRSADSLTENPMTSRDQGRCIGRYRLGLAAATLRYEANNGFQLKRTSSSTILSKGPTQPNQGEGTS
jgi:hypothetical protein